jgi:hypothetical protein
MRSAYRDLAEYGLPFVTPSDAGFDALVEDIRSRHRLGPPPPPQLDYAAVLLNQTGKALITLAWIWKFTDSAGQTRTHSSCNLGSSIQMDVLAGRAPVQRDRWTLILPGSKRLITRERMFGDNTDVLPPEPFRGGGVGSGGGGLRPGLDIETVELQLDAVIFEDGICAGPDEYGLFDAVTSALEAQSNLARQMADAIRAGASVGTLFEILRPHAQHRSVPPRSGLHLQIPFARQVLDELVHWNESQLLAWLEGFSAPQAFQLRRAL